MSAPTNGQAHVPEFPVPEHPWEQDRPSRSLESLSRAIGPEMIHAIRNKDSLAGSTLNLASEHPHVPSGLSNNGPTTTTHLPEVGENQVYSGASSTIVDTPKPGSTFELSTIPKEPMVQDTRKNESVKLPLVDAEKNKHDLESGSVPPAKGGDETEKLRPQTPQEKKKSNLHFAVLCFSLFGMGWNDGTAGPLLPRIQEHYHVGFAVVSLIFVLNAVGYVVGGLLNVYLNDKLGFGKVLVIAGIVQLVAYVMIIPAGPFPLMIVAYGLVGFALSFQNANGNAYVASLKRRTKTKMGILHGTYGLGAFISPLVSTQFAKSPTRWSFHFIASAGLYVMIIIALWVVLKGKRQDELLAEEGEIIPERTAEENKGKFGKIIRLKTLHFLAAFAIIYVGIEVTLGGWSVTYLIEKRGGDESTGYVSSGFFGGLMLGRVLLLWVNKKLGERTAVVVYGVIAIGLDITVWVVPSLIENAIAVSIVGVLLGPMYPILMHQAAVVLPPSLLSGCMGFIAGVASAGSAILPFLTGLLASRFGITSLQPFIVTMTAIMISIWASIFISRRLSRRKGDSAVTEKTG